MDKRSSYRTGLSAEAFCCLWLCLRGYRIIARRYKTSVGEIDILAAKNKTLAVIEVKARPSREEAITSIHPRQRDRLANAINIFLAHDCRFQNHSIRFDAMLVTPHSFPAHLKNAWEGKSF